MNAELAAWIWTGEIHIDPPPAFRICAADYPNADLFFEALNAHVDQRR